MSRLNWDFLKLASFFIRFHHIMKQYSNEKGYIIKAYVDKLDARKP